jgi:hypothetical protein
MLLKRDEEATSIILAAAAQLGQAATDSKWPQSQG